MGVRDDEDKQRVEIYIPTALIEALEKVHGPLGGDPRHERLSLGRALLLTAAQALGVDLPPEVTSPKKGGRPSTLPARADVEAAVDHLEAQGVAVTLNAVRAAMTTLGKSGDRHKAVRRILAEIRADRTAATEDAVAEPAVEVIRPIVRIGGIEAIGGSIQPSDDGAFMVYLPTTSAGISRGSRAEIRATMEAMGFVVNQYRAYETRDPRLAARFRHFGMSDEMAAAIDAASGQRHPSVAVYRHKGEWLAVASEPSDYEVLIADGWVEINRLSRIARSPGREVVGRYQHRMTEEALAEWEVLAPLMQALPPTEVPDHYEALEAFEDGWADEVTIGSATITAQSVTSRVRGGGVGGSATLKEAVTYTRWRTLDVDNSGLSGSGRSGSLEWPLDDDGLYFLWGTPETTQRVTDGHFLCRGDQVRLVTKEDAQRYKSLAWSASAANLEAAKAVMPDLNGSQRQVDWATEIRNTLATRLPLHPSLAREAEACWWIEHRFDLLGDEAV